MFLFECRAFLGICTIAIEIFYRNKIYISIGRTGFYEENYPEKWAYYTD